MREVVESLVSYPATVTHGTIPALETKKRIGLSDGLVRFSIGIEDSGDLIHDLDQSLEMAT